MTRRLLSVCLLFPLACTSAQPETGSPTSSSFSITVTEPARGAVVTGGSALTVRGHVDPGPDTVMVHGVETAVQPDGAFTQQLSLPSGLTLIEVVARHGSSEARDIRAVRTGQPADQGAPIDNALTIEINTGFLDGVARASRNIVKNGGFEAALVEFDSRDVDDDLPIDIGASVKLVAAGMKHVDVALAPRDGGIRVTAEVHDLDASVAAKLFVFAVPEIGSYRINHARVALDLDVGMSNGRIVLGLQSLETEIAGALLELFELPEAFRSVIAELLDEQIGKVLGKALSAAIQSMINPMLAQLDEATFETDALGMPAVLALSPSELSFTDDGARIGASISLRFPDNADVGVMYTPDIVPAASASPLAPGLRLGVADDVVNQYLTVLWGSGSLNRTASLEDTLAGQFLNFSRIELLPMLPPEAQVNSDGTARLTIGDTMVDVFDRADNRVLRLAMSGSVSLAAKLGQTGHLELVTHAPQMWVALVGPDGTSTPSAQIPPELSEAVLAELEPLINDALNAIPSLRLDDVTILAPSIRAATGYLLLGAEFQYDDGAQIPTAPPANWDTPDEVEPEPELAGTGCAVGASGDNSGGDREGAIALLSLCAVAAALLRRRRRVDAAGVI